MYFRFGCTNLKIILEDLTLLSVRWILKASLSFPKSENQEKKIFRADKSDKSFLEGKSRDIWIDLGRRDQNQ